MASIIFHIDVNSAYLSWTAVEQLKNGATVDLREIPPSSAETRSPAMAWCSPSLLLRNDMASARGNLLRMPFVSARIL